MGGGENELLNFPVFMCTDCDTSRAGDYGQQ